MSAPRLLTAGELGAVLAGLRALQEAMSRRAGAPPAHLAEIATDGGSCAPLSLSEIDALAERLNEGLWGGP